MRYTVKPSELQDIEDFIKLPGYIQVAVLATDVYFDGLEPEEPLGLVLRSDSCDALVPQGFMTVDKLVHDSENQLRQLGLPIPPQAWIRSKLLDFPPAEFLLIRGYNREEIFALEPEIKVLLSEKGEFGLLIIEQSEYISKSLGKELPPTTILMQDTLEEMGFNSVAIIPEGQNAVMPVLYAATRDPIDGKIELLSDYDF